jgi:ADP-ribose pyrophosphatase YjhB (NUDIX family)
MILLVREQCDGLWTLPGGFADVGLSPARNIEKEIHEEAGLRVSARRLFGVLHKAGSDYSPVSGISQDVLPLRSDRLRSPSAGPRNHRSALLRYGGTAPLVARRTSAIAARSRSTGYITSKEARQRASAAGAECPKPVRPEVSAALGNYIDLHRHAAVRASLLSDTGVAMLRMMVAHAIVGSPLWRVDVESSGRRAMPSPRASRCR